MDQRAAKRPLSDSKILPPPKKKSKKSKSSKQQHGHHSSEKDAHPANSLELTATAEGITMTQVLSTFSRLEQSRFEAFRRCTFRGDAISDYVAHCLAASEERAYARQSKARLYLGASNDNTTNQRAHCPYVKNSNATTTSSTRKKRSLNDMVPPGQADEITVVVSTLAKAYAQRLVTAARRVAAAQGADESQPLDPSQVLTAYHSRVQAGLDPGFFLQKPRATTVQENSAAVAAALGTVDANALQRSAALAAQEEYDKYIEEQKSKEDNAMDVDEPVSTKETEGSGSAKKQEESVEKEGDNDVEMKQEETENTASADDAKDDEAKVEPASTPKEGAKVGAASEKAGESKAKAAVKSE